MGAMRLDMTSMACCSSCPQDRSQTEVLDDLVLLLFMSHLLHLILSAVIGLIYGQ